MPSNREFLAALKEVVKEQLESEEISGDATARAILYSMELRFPPEPDAAREEDERRSQSPAMPPGVPPVPKGWHYWEGSAGPYYLECSPNHPLKYFHGWRMVALAFIKPKYPHTNESNGAVWYTARPDKKDFTYEDASALIDGWRKEQGNG